VRVRGPGLVVVIALALATGGAHADAGASAPNVAAGSLNLQAVLRLASNLGACPPGVSAETCAPRTSEGLVPGLGSVTGTYTFLADLGPPSCSDDLLGKALGYPVRFVVAAKGEIHFTLADGAQCVPLEAVRTHTQAFTVTGGTGVYANATGSGTVERTLGGQTATGRTGTETWRGTLSVPGLEFDTTPPAISGAVAKTVRAPRGAKRVRVTYSVRARDDVDGAVPVSCRPGSGSRFKIGRTVITCSATDTSGNTQTARFAVTVKRRR
jgi:hypothetical protein